MEALYFSAFFYCVASVIISIRSRSDTLSDKVWGVLWLGGLIGAAALTIYITHIANSILLATFVLLIFGALAKALMPCINLFGAGYLTCKFSLPVGVMIAVDHAMQSLYPTASMWIIYCLLQTMFLAGAVFYTLCGLLIDLPKYTLNYPKLNAAQSIINRAPSRTGPKVSIHLPCYSEPPQLVINTLDAIAQLDHENIEVLVIDNNTKDTLLWRPVEEYCATLGSRFRFFHVEPLAGAKSGALNFALRQTAADAELVMVVDADYIVQPDFISRFISLFDDPNTGFVQTSQDYREWQNNPFLVGVYYHYIPPHKTINPALSEYNIGCLAGTVCMIRRTLLDELHGWAEWALAEDLELSMRAMSAGYTGYVFAETWGYGLIPETIEGLKKQQFRWWAGANQDFRIHWRRYFGLDPTIKLTCAQRSMRFYAVAKDLLHTGRFIAEILLIILCFYLIANGTDLYLSDGILFLMLAFIPEQSIKIWIEVKALGGRTRSDYLLTLLLKGSLRWTKITAFFLPMIGKKMKWVRTNKFKQSSSLINSIYASRSETLIGLVYLCSATLIFYFGSFKNLDLLALGSLVIFVSGMCFMSTLLMAIISDRALGKPHTIRPVQEDPAQHTGVRLTDSGAASAQITLEPDPPF